jgi:hypothetical protein
MSYTIQKLKDDLTRKLHGTSLRKLGDVIGLINEAARVVVQEVDIAETKRSQQITNAVYSEVYDYQLPVDLKDDKIIDIYPQFNNSISNNNVRLGSADFDMNKKDGSFSIRYANTLKTLRLSKDTNGSKTLSDLNSISGWAVGGATENLLLDSLYTVSGGYAVKFDFNVSGTSAYIENSTLDSLDLSLQEDEGAMFLYIYLPDAAKVTAVNLKFGSSNVNYWSKTVTTTNEGTAFVDGWNLLRFDWRSASSSGTPVASAIDYARITLTTDGTAGTDIRVDSLVYRLGSIYNLDYYSKYLFRTTGGVWSEELVDDDTIINADTTSYNILLYKCEELAAQELQGEDSAFDSSISNKRYVEAREKYKSLYKSEAKKKRLTYYNV